MALRVGTVAEADSAGLFANRRLLAGERLGIKFTRKAIEAFLKGE